MPLFSANKLVCSVASAHTSVTMGPIDICKTPAPPAPSPVPMPYPNVGITSTPGPGYATKTMAISTPIWIKGGKIGVSNGDQPGVAMGIRSNKIMGMCDVTMASSDVDAEGGALTRSADSTGNNG